MRSRLYANTSPYEAALADSDLFADIHVHADIKLSHPAMPTPTKGVVISFDDYIIVNSPVMHTRIQHV